VLTGCSTLACAAFLIAITLALSVCCLPAGASAHDADLTDVLFSVKVDNFVDDAEDDMSSVTNESSAAAAAVKSFELTPVLTISLISELQTD
jgi:hypothetical protein